MTAAYSPRELSRAISDVAQRALDERDMVHPLQCVKMLRAEHPEMVEFLARGLADKQLLRRFQSELAGRRGQGDGRIELPGLGPIDSRITINDAEGGYAYKLLRKATAADLEADARILLEHANAATASALRAGLRNDYLLPIMQKHKLATVGEALEFLAHDAAA